MPSFFFGEKKVYKFIPIFLFILSGCNNNNVAVAETSPSNEFEVKTQNNSTLGNQALSSIVTVKLAQVSTYQNLSLRLVDLEDSRCATGVNCIWAGQIVVTLEVSNQSTDKTEVKLIRKRESNIVTAFGYHLSLLDVTPHPKKDKVIQLNDQIVTLEVVKS
jgi:hypothetical protein